jgi:chorismate mutase
MQIKLSLMATQSWLPHNKPLLIAGPCSAETETQVLQTASQIKSNFPNFIYRAGLWKPRSRAGNFEGVGNKGLKWLQVVQQQLNIKVCTEVANVKHVDACLKAGVDMLWIGARTTANPFSVQEIANALKGVDIPVMVKNPISDDLDLWIGAIERLNLAGINKIIAIHRGFFSPKESEFRNQPLWEMPIKLKATLPELSIICDPSHITGNPKLIPQIAQKALDLDMDGLMIETHLNPKIALSDAAQQVTPAHLKTIINSLVVRNQFSNSIKFKNKLEQLREEIDFLDNELIDLLARRMAVSKKIGAFKKSNNVTILQIRRWKKILQTQTKHGKIVGFDNEFIRSLFNLIHDESIKVQTSVMNK